MLLCTCGYSRQEHWSGLSCPHPGNLPNPGIELRSPSLQVDFLPSEPPGKPKNIGVHSLSLLQGSLLTQESNQGLLHCRWILYHLATREACIHVFSRQEYFLAWRIPWTEEPGGLQSMGSQRVGHEWASNTYTHTHDTYICTYVYIYILYVLCIYNILQCKMDLRIKISSRCLPEPLAEDQLKNH